jgi:hypothetical protein
VEKIAPAGVDVDVRLIHSGDPCLIPVDNPYIQAATRALHEVWGKDTVFIRSGGSIPIVGDFDRHLGLPSVMMGFGLPDDNLHAPNEKFNLKNFSLGIESLIRFLEELGRFLDAVRCAAPALAYRVPAPSRAHNRPRRHRPFDERLYPDLSPLFWSDPLFPNSKTNCIPGNAAAFPRSGPQRMAWANPSPASTSSCSRNPGRFRTLLAFLQFAGSTT